MAGVVSVRVADPLRRTARLAVRRPVVDVLVVALLGGAVALGLTFPRAGYAPVGVFILSILLAVAGLPTRVLAVTLLAVASYAVTAHAAGVPALVLLINGSALALFGIVAAAYVARRREGQDARTVAERERQLRVADERLRVALASAPIVVFNQDAALRYTFFYNSQVGLTEADVRGRTDVEVFGPLDGARITAVKRRVLETGIGQRVELFVTFGGQRRCYDMTAEPLRDDQDRSVGLTGSATDVTARKRAEARRLFEATLLENIQDSVIATDLAGTITYWNEGARRLFGYTAGEMLGQTPALLYPDQDPSRLSADLAGVLEGHDYVGEWLGRRKDGTRVWIDVKTSLVRDADGQPDGFIGVATNISARKELERERAGLLEREQAARRQLQQFLALVAHDLSQPLTGIRGNAQLLRRRGKHDERDAARLEAIEEAAARMQRLIEDLRDAATIGAGQFAIQPARMDLVAAVEQIVAEQRAAAPGHRIVVEAPEQLPGTWDAHRVGQLVGNLVTNAVKYSPSGTTVRVGIERSAAEALIRVADEGPGIASEQRDALFSPFTRLGAAVGTDGTGLGLYIARGIVEAHGGGIRIESEPGAGTSVIVALPLAAPNAS